MRALNKLRLQLGTNREKPTQKAAFFTHHSPYCKKKSTSIKVFNEKNNLRKKNTMEIESVEGTCAQTWNMSLKLTISSPRVLIFIIIR